MKIIDTHCHPYLNRNKKSEDILKNFFENGWENLIIIWTDLKTSKKSIEIAKKNEKIFATIWVHPCDCENMDLEKTISDLENIYEENKEKIVAIWEIWLDYYRILKDSENATSVLQTSPSKREIKKKSYISKRKEEQKIFFKAQINLAKKLNLPIIIHNRESWEDVFEILKEENFKNFVFHSFSENLDFARKVLDFAPNSMISFSWVLTFKNASDIKEVSKEIPLKNILAETDSPYLTPVPFRWKQENEPIFTKYVIEEIAKLREEDLEFVAENILENSKKFFWI